MSAPLSPSEPSQQVLDGRARLVRMRKAMGVVQVLLLVLVAVLITSVWAEVWGVFQVVLWFVVAVGYWGMFRFHRRIAAAEDCQMLLELTEGGLDVD